MYQSVHNEWDLFDSNAVIDVLIDYVNYRRKNPSFMYFNSD